MVKEVRDAVAAGALALRALRARAESMVFGGTRPVKIIFEFIFDWS